MRSSKLAFVALSMLTLLVPFAGVALADAEVHTVQAEVLSASAESITIKPDDAEALTLEITDETKVVKDGQRIAAEELSAGDRVSVNYQDRAEAGPVALAVSVLS